jgi:hypothetical protein
MCGTVSHSCLPHVSICFWHLDACFRFSPFISGEKSKKKRTATIGRGVAWLGPIAWMAPSLWLKPTTRTLRSWGRSWWWGSGRPQKMIQAWRYLWISYYFIWINVTLSLSIPDWIQVIGIWFRYFDWFDQKVSTKSMSTHKMREQQTRK